MSSRATCEVVLIMRLVGLVVAAGDVRDTVIRCVTRWWCYNAN